MKILKAFDLFLLRYVFESVLHKFQRRTGKDNFWVEEFVANFANKILTIYSLCMIFLAKEVGFGIVLLVCSGLMCFTFNANLYEKISKGTRKHPMRRRAEKVRNGVLKGLRNPDEYNNIDTRIVFDFLTILSVWMGYWIFLQMPDMIIYPITEISFVSCYTIIFYIRDCTPLPPQVVKKKQKKISARLASVES